MNGEKTPDAVAIDAWWNAVLAGADEPHPIYGDDLKVSIRQGVLRLAGTLPTEDRDELLKGAGAFVGHGIDAVDPKRLKLLKRTEKVGILEQTLIAGFRNREVAELARAYLVGIRRLKAKALEVLGSELAAKPRRLVPEDFVRRVEKAFADGEAVLVVRVDETEAFKVREMLAEDTRSRWTVATPPTPAAKAP
ncbi:MAG: hypothetical protein ABI959_07460 [Candidatus Dormiibacterota bacterium]